MTRSLESLLAVVTKFDVANNKKYQRRDVTGDGHPETFCNYYVHDITKELGCPVPLTLANSQIDWLDSAQGIKNGWTRCSTEDAGEYAELGYPVVAGFRELPHGHIALTLPGQNTGGELDISQAGRVCLTRAPLSYGFGKRKVMFWLHA